MHVQVQPPVCLMSCLSHIMNDIDNDWFLYPDTDFQSIIPYIINAISGHSVDNMQ